MGIISLLTLPIEKYPDIAPPTVNVWASYPGASADAVRKAVVAPLEEAINGVDNMTYMTSQASNGSASVTLHANGGELRLKDVATVELGLADYNYSTHINGKSGVMGMIMVFGMIPLMFATGVGANGSRTIGVGTVGGMCFGTLGLLFVTPALFVVFQTLQERFKPIREFKSTTDPLILQEMEKIMEYEKNKKS